MPQLLQSIGLDRGRPAGQAAGERSSGHMALYHSAMLILSTGVLAGSLLLWPREEGLSLFGHRWPFYCRLYETLGIKCALCGLSRSFCSLAHGDVAASLGFHLLGPVVFVLFCLEVPYRLCHLSGHPRVAGIGLTRVHFCMVVLVATALFANWLLYLGGLIV